MTDILKQINGAAMRANPMMTKIQQFTSAIRAARNPQAMLESMPQMKQVKEIINRYGGDPMKAFREMAEENGLDPDEILRMISG